MNIVIVILINNLMLGAWIYHILKKNEDLFEVALLFEKKLKKMEDAARKETKSPVRFKHNVLMVENPHALPLTRGIYLEGINLN